MISMTKEICTFLWDFYHNHDNAYPVIKKAVERIENVSLTDCKIEELSAVIDKNPDVIFLGREDRLNPEDETVNRWLTNALDDKITSYVKNGGSLIAMHTAIASYPENSKYVDMLKGYFITHPPEHYLVRYKSNEKLPFPNSQAYDFEIMDEHYVVYVDTENTNVFMSHSSAYGEGHAGWYHSYGKGKVMVIVPTHNKEGFEHPEMLRLIHEAITLALGDQCA